ncbi:helix-turn-helix domain-containing protein [Jongsikchunia kroppenstedtii]|uniref:helix-turn-helix domain-containing protein n=1 Tax=Jongsikchunia kroppenstedtii TaxID=1121721 RepID=UPI0003638135|nr:helix-turn-helix domain-containing protein [Jongsikchunia kroppenstedtii]
MTAKVEQSETARQELSPPTGRVIAVMELLGAEPERSFSLADICRALDISRATGHAILTTLADRLWVVRDPTDATYSWGPAIAALARPAGPRQYRPHLQALADEVGTYVFLARREGSSLMIVDGAGEGSGGSRIGRGTRTPLVAPLGRDYVAWAGAADQREWLAGFGEPNEVFAHRIELVLNEIRRRGYVVERLSREYIRASAALGALGADGLPDALAARLAGALAELTVIDVLPTELEQDAQLNIATVSAPIANPDGAVTMSVAAAPFAVLTPSDIETMGEHVRHTARQIEAQLARYGEAAPR